MLLRKLPLRNKRKTKQAVEPPMFHDGDRTGSLIVSSGSRLALHQLVDPFTNNPVDITAPGVGTLLRSASKSEPKDQFQVKIPYNDSINEAGPVVTVSFALHRAHPAQRPAAKLPSFDENDSAFSSSCDTDSDSDACVDEGDYAEVRPNRSSEEDKMKQTVQYAVAASKEADVVYYELASADTTQPRRESPVYAEAVPLASRQTSPEKSRPALPPRIDIESVHESDGGYCAIINDSVDYRRAARHTTSSEHIYEEPEMYFPQYSLLHSTDDRETLSKSSPGYSKLASPKQDFEAVDEGYAVLYPIKGSSSNHHVYSQLSPTPDTPDKASTTQDDSSSNSVKVIGRNVESIQRVAQRWRISDRDAAEIMQAVEDANSSTQGW